MPSTRNLTTADLNQFRREQFLKGLRPLLPPNCVCAEVGVASGVFSAFILEHLSPSQLFLIDPWGIGSADANAPVTHYLNGLATAYSNERDLKGVRERFKKQIQEGSVVLKRGFSYDVVESFPDDFFDFIYIDACHIYESVKADLEMFLPKLKDTGLMCGHDYINVRKWGVIEAVEEYKSLHGLSWAIPPLLVSGEEEHTTDWALYK